MDFISRSTKAKAICQEQWSKPKPSVDPCSYCPLYRPCILQAVVVPGIGAFNEWINGINRATEQLAQATEPGHSTQP